MSFSIGIVYREAFRVHSEGLGCFFRRLTQDASKVVGFWILFTTLNTYINLNEGGGWWDH
jgi:hypothetical protein